MVLQGEGILYLQGLKGVKAPSALVLADKAVVDHFTEAVVPQVLFPGGLHLLRLGEIDRRKLHRGESLGDLVVAVEDRYLFDDIDLPLQVAAEGGNRDDDTVALLLDCIEVKTAQHGLDRGIVQFL